MGATLNQGCPSEQCCAREQTNMTRHARPILLVEDDRVDIMTVQRAFKELHIPPPAGVRPTR